MKILIIGNYGATNLGDEAILAGMIREIGLRSGDRHLSRDFEITALSNNPGKTAAFHKIKAKYLLPFGLHSALRGIFKLDLFRTLKVIRDADLVLIGGGGLFTDEKMMAIWLWGWHFWVSKLFGKKVWMYGQSVGPLQRKISRKIVKTIFNRSFRITVRDEKSRALLKKIGVKTEIEVRSDPAFNLTGDKRIFEKFTDLSRRKFVVMSLRDWPGLTDEKIGEIAEFCDFLIAHGYKIVMIPFQNHQSNDAIVLWKVREQVENYEKVAVPPYDDDIWNVLGLMQKADFVVGMRLHCLIFAEMVKVPYCAICYSDKVWGFLEEMKKKSKGVNVKEISFLRLKSLFEAGK